MMLHNDRHDRDSYQENHHTDQNFQRAPDFIFALFARDQGTHSITHTRSRTSTSKTIGKYTIDASSNRRAAFELPGERTIVTPNASIQTPIADAITRYGIPA